MTAMSWLLDPSDPGARYLALRDLCDLSFGDSELETAREEAYTRGPIAEILAAMNPEGYWVEPGPGYNPKYISTVWAVILLAQLGASAKHDPRIARSCAYLLDHALASGGQFSTTGSPSGTADCLQGNLCWALLELEYADERISRAFEWMARTVTGEGLASIQDRDAPLRYYAGKCGPLFACGSNNKLPCAWGAAKVMLAFAHLPSSGLPAERCTPLMTHAIQVGTDFLLDNHPAEAGYPNGWADKPSGNWWKFGFPVFYVTDLLQIVEAAARLGYGNDPRLADAVRLIRQKQDPQGRWALEYDYAGKTYGSYGVKRQPNKWVTIRAMRTLRLLESKRSG